VFWMIVVMAAISMLLSEWGWRNKATANFYLAPTRAWELFSGSIAAFIVQKRGVQKNDLLATIGLLAVILSIIIYDETTPFPSVYALVPVLGVVLLIIFAQKETFTARFLSNKLFVGIGLISYSAYLWHQPLFAFARLRIVDNQSIALFSLLSIGSLALAYISWRYVEKPYRDKNKFNSKTVLVTSVCMLSLPVVISILLNDQNLNRLVTNKKTFSDYGYIEAKHENIGYTGCEGLMLTNQCGHKPDTRVVAWGDSYAKHAIPFVQIYEKSSVAQLALSSCTPFIGSLEEPRIARNAKEIAKCSKFNKKVMNIIEDRENIDTVIISSRFSLIEFKTKEQILELADKFYSELSIWLNTINRPIKLVIFPPPPTPNYDPSRCIDKHILFGFALDKCNFKASEYGEFYLKQKTFIDYLEKKGVDVYPLEKTMCPNNECITLRESVRIFRDYGHLRNEASSFLGNQSLISLPNE